MLRYFFDEHILSAVAEQLIARGIDVLTMRAAGLAHWGIADDILLRYATEHGRVMITEDRDFIELAYAQQPQEGLILLQRPLSSGGFVEYLELMARISPRQKSYETN